MTRKKLLFLLTDEHEINIASKFSKALKNKFGYIDTHAVYVKDIMKYELFPTSIDGITIHNSTAILVNEYKNLETSIYENLKKTAFGNFDKVYSVEGETVEVIMEELKAYDGLIVVKNDELSYGMQEILKITYKPLIILSKEDKEYNFEKILMLNDGGVKVNRSIFAYFNLFGERNIDVLRVNVEDRNRLTERFGNICNIIDKTGDNEHSIIEEFSKTYDMIVMGGLSYSFLLERLTGQTGLKIIESSKNPIFIG